MRVNDTELISARQPPSPRVRADLGGRRVGVSDAHQVIEQQHIVIGGIGDLVAHLCARRLIVELGYSGGFAQQPRRHKKGDIAGVRLAEN